MPSAPEAWVPALKERYERALAVAWDDFETAYRQSLRRAGVSSMAAQHAQNYMRRARLLKEMVDGLLAKPTMTDQTPQAIRNAVSELVEFKNAVNRL